MIRAEFLNITEFGNSLITWVDCLHKGIFMSVEDDMKYINNESNHLGGLARKMTELMYTLLIALNATALVTTINALPSDPKTPGLLLIAAIAFASGVLWTLGIVIFSVVLVYGVLDVWQELVRDYTAGKITIVDVYKKYTAADVKRYNPLYWAIPGAITFVFGLTIGFVAIFIQY